MLLNFNSKTKTIIVKIIKIGIHKRFTGGGKKVVEEVTKKCIGAGCPSTRPFMPKDNTMQNKPVASLPSTKTNIKDEDSVSRNTPLPAYKPAPQLPKEITSLKQITSSNTVNNKTSEKNVKENCIQNSPESALTSEFSQQPQERDLDTPLTPSPLSDNDINIKSSSVINNVTIQEDKKENLDSSKFVDDAINIPTAPPLPEKTIVKKNDDNTLFSKQISDVYKRKEYKKEMLDEIKRAKQEHDNLYAEKGDTTNIKPSELFKGKTFSNKPYTTTISSETKPEDITDEQLREELLKRELVKSDDGKTAVTIKLQDGTDYLLGGTLKYKEKLTPLGQAYYDQLPKQTNIPNENTVHKKQSDETIPLEHIMITETSQEIVPVEKPKYGIIVPPKSSDDCFIETGKQKHLLVLVDDQGNFFSFGYLTSKKSGYSLSDIQVKAFQEEQESMKSDNTLNKPQNYVIFDNLVEIDKKDIKYVKWDLEYLNTLSEKIIKELKIAFEEKKVNPIVIYNKNGLTKEKLLNICKEHDKIATQKKPKHPLSKDQVKQNEKSKLKQQQNNTSNYETSS